jgi:hypothetical protein
MKKQNLNKVRMQELAGIIKENVANRYKLIDPEQTSKSLDTLLAAAQLLNDNGLEVQVEDEGGGYDGGYTHINTLNILSPIPFNQFYKKAVDVLKSDRLKTMQFHKIKVLHWPLGK